MKTNDIKKGTLLRLRNGLYVRMFDNMRGNRRMIQVVGTEDIPGEISSTYSHDIMSVFVDGLFEPVEHTKSQIDLRKQVMEVFGG